MSEQQIGPPADTAPPADAPAPDPPPVIDLTADEAPMRLERDALGPLAIPAGASYGIHTARAVNALAISPTRLSDYPDLVSALGAVKQAAEDAGDNATSGIVDDWTDQAEQRAWFALQANQLVNSLRPRLQRLAEQA